MNVCAVIVNYRSSETAIETITTLYQEFSQIEYAHIIIIDNDSNDGSFEKINNLIQTNNWQPTVKIIATGRNGGFGAGNNVGIRAALAIDSPPEFFYLINPDAIPEKGSIQKLIDHLEKNPKTGIASGSIKRPNGKQQISTFTFPNIIDECLKGFSIGFLRRIFNKYLVADKIIHKTCEVDWVSGACFMIRASVFKDIGCFDERFFLYFEEIDLCHRAKNAGWRIQHVADCGVIHICGVATGIQDMEKRTPKYLFHSRKYYFKKHHGILYLWGANILFIAGSLLNLIKIKLQRKKHLTRPYFLRDFVRNSF